ncbi:MAG: flavodoxin family protein [Bacteroidales bacterium]|nr:flavodoxin family protein [Bacteroidales bacterium]MBN2761628.1 flavodoxin family protein [Bacteroidales bacterium]
MKVTAFVGSARKKHTYYATQRFLQNLQKYGDIEYEIICLGDYHLKICRGCKLCTDKGEEFCPLKDDRDKLFDKIDHSDGVVFASPNYSFGVSGLMKVFLDRFGFIFHRPRFFGKAWSNIVVQGVYGGKKINEYFNFIGNCLGFNVVKGCCVKSLEPMTEKDQRIFDSIIDKQSKKFYKTLIRKEYRVPSFFELMMFRMARTSMSLMLDETYRDYTYFKEKGWFESGFYYPVRLNLLKKVAGRFFDFLFTRIYGRGDKMEKSVVLN